MIRHLKHFFASLFFFCLVLFTYGQGSTTSLMSGKIIDEQDQPMAGATVVGVHGPSGPVYGATTNSQGLYSIEGMRPGGPYKYKLQLQP
jgi:hypothetical protein